MGREGGIVREPVPSYSPANFSSPSSPPAYHLRNCALLQARAPLVDEEITPSPCSCLQVNQLRNYARLQARTPLVGIVDADLLVSPLLVEELSHASRQAFYLDALTKGKEK